MTTAAGYYMGARGPVGWLHLIHAVFGTMLIAAGHSGHESFIDASPTATAAHRLCDRLPSGVTAAREAWSSASRLAIAGPWTCMWQPGRLLRVGIATSLSYLLAYTPLKKTHRVATFVGAFPRGHSSDDRWVAATGSLDRGAWLLFGILFSLAVSAFPCHRWMYREDYARAGIMMPAGGSTARARARSRQTFCYAAAHRGVSLLPLIWAGRRGVFLWRAGHQHKPGAGMPVGCQQQDERSCQVAYARDRCCTFRFAGLDGLRQAAALIRACFGKNEFYSI